MSGSPMTGEGSERTRRSWTEKEDDTLRLLVSYWGDHCGKNSHWGVISGQLQNRTPKDCRKRWFHSLDPKLRRGKWTAQEDRTLLAAYESLGPAWQRIAQQIPGRTDDQCAKRYNDVLNPEFKERLRPWTHEEDKLLMELVEKLGTKWSDISKQMERRTGLVCRNRWRKLLREKTFKAESPATADTAQPGSLQSLDLPADQELDEKSPQVNISYSDPLRAIGGHSDIRPVPSRPSSSTELAAARFRPIQESLTLSFQDSPDQPSPVQLSQQQFPIQHADLERVLSFAASRGQQVVININCFGQMPPGSINYSDTAVSTTRLTTADSHDSQPRTNNGLTDATSSVVVMNVSSSSNGPAMNMGSHILSQQPGRSQPQSIQITENELMGPAYEDTAFGYADEIPDIARPDMLSSNLPSQLPSQAPTPGPGAGVGTGDPLRLPDELVFGSGFYDVDPRINPFASGEMSQFDFMAFNPS